MESTERHDKYIQFPLCLLMETYKDTLNGWLIVMSFGVVHYAKSFDYKIEEVGRQLMYCYYRKQEIIPKTLLKKLQSYIDQEELKIDEQYFGFSGDTFDPLGWSEELLDLFIADQQLKESAVLLYQIRQVISDKFLGICIINIDDLLNRYRQGVELREAFELRFGSDVMVGVKLEQIFSFQDSDSSEREMFRAFIGIKSMIGRKKFAVSNKPAILSRMVGCKNKAAFEYFTANQEGLQESLLPTVEKYKKRYCMDKLIHTLAERKFIMYLSKQKVREIYLSGYMEPEELGKLIAETKAVNNLKQKIKDVAANL